MVEICFPGKNKKRWKRVGGWRHDSRNPFVSLFFFLHITGGGGGGGPLVFLLLLHTHSFLIWFGVMLFLKAFGHGQMPTVHRDASYGQEKRNKRLPTQGGKKSTHLSSTYKKKEEKKSLEWYWLYKCVCVCLFFSPTLLYSGWSSLETRNHHHQKKKKELGEREITSSAE